MTHSELRAVVIECLKQDRPYDPSSQPLQVEYLYNEVAEITKARGLKTLGDIHNAWLMDGGRAELHPSLQEPVAGVVWDLILERILRPGTSTGSSFMLPQIHVTEYGKEALKHEHTPYDPDGYVKKLTDTVPKVDPVIVKYVTESAKSLRGDCLLASTITIGCASEKVFLLLIDAYAAALNPTDRGLFDAAIRKARTIKLQHAEFKDCYEKKLKAKLKAGGMHSDWITELENALHFVFSYFRDVRNDAGHPTGVSLGREVVLSHLVVFPAYARVLYELIDWLGTNKPV